MSSDKLLSDFIKAQTALIQTPINPPKKHNKQNKQLMNRKHPEEIEEEGFEYIITKKPKAKKVVKYLQGMVNDILADADN
jgi:hypothetical protein